MRKRLVSLVTAACLLWFAHPAHAADPTKVDVSGGYAFLDDGSDSQTFNGWAASFGYYFNDWLGFVGEVGDGYATATSPSSVTSTFGVAATGASASLSELTFLAGPKFVSHGNSKFTPFVQLLVGAARLGSSASGTSLVLTDFVAQPGGGVDVNVTPSLGLRLQADYRLISVGAVGPNPLVLSNNNLRLLVGVVYRH